MVRGVKQIAAVIQATERLTVPDVAGDHPFYDQGVIDNCRLGPLFCQGLRYADNLLPLRWEGLFPDRPNAG